MSTILSYWPLAILWGSIGALIAGLALFAHYVHIAPVCDEDGNPVTYRDALDADLTDDSVAVWEAIEAAAHGDLGVTYTGGQGDVVATAVRHPSGLIRIETIRTGVTA